MDNLSEVFLEAGTLMLAGMCFVFIFLGLLVLVINFVLAPLAERFPDAVPKAKPSNKPRAAAATGAVSPQVVAAITSAVATYRNKNKTE